MTTIPNLTDTQLVLLSSAVQRADHLVVLPEKLKGGAAKSSVSRLFSLDLVEELSVRADEPHWRKDDSDHPIGLKLTRAGLLALGIEPEDGAGEEQQAGAQELAPGPKPSRKPVPSGEGSAPVGAWVPREGSKQALVLSLLCRPEGATIDDLLSATGWLPHTTRAALTGLRKRGYEFVKSKNEAGETVYRTAAPAVGTVGPVPSDGGERHEPSPANAAALA